MADIVTGKKLVEEEKRTKGAVDHKIKMKFERKMEKKSWRRDVGVRKCFGCTSRRVVY